MRSTLSLSPIPRESIDTLPFTSKVFTLYNKQQDSIEGISFAFTSEDQAHHSFKLPPLTDKTKLQGLSSKNLSLLVDLGLSPNVKLSHENLIKFKNAKKKSITISDFMRKSDKKKLLASPTLANIFTQDDKKKAETPKTLTFAEFMGFHSTAKKSGSFQVLPMIESAESESSKVSGNKFKKEEGLKKIEKILESCDNLLHSKKNTNKGRRVIWRRSI
jgi:phosphatidate phosphatase PAH1